MAKKEGASARNEIFEAMEPNKKKEFGTVIDRWAAQCASEGHYAAFAGFEKDLHQWSESLSLAYDDMDIYQQIQLFAFVAELLAEEVNG